MVGSLGMHVSLRGLMSSFSLAKQYNNPATPIQPLDCSTNDCLTKKLRPFAKNA
jgi:hypothetical protein